VSKHERERLINLYKEGYAAVVEALKGITEEELDFSFNPGVKWTPREIVHHLADSEMMSALRLRRLIAEERPYIQAYDENTFAKALLYSRRPIEPALRALEAARATTAQIFEQMTDEHWARAGEHSADGPYSSEKWLEVYSVHAHNHADQIRRNREAFAKRRT
jgi:hypothetical protein